MSDRGIALGNKTYSFSIEFEVPLDDEDEYESFCEIMGIEPVYPNGKPAIVTDGL